MTSYLTYSVKNFKSLKKINDLKVKRLTFLFGKNGSGKSSFIESLLFLSHNLQTLPDPRDYQRRERINTSFFKTKDIDLISFKDITNFTSKEDEIYYKIDLSVFFETYGKKFSDIIIDLNILGNGDIGEIKKLANNLQEYFNPLESIKAELEGKKIEIFDETKEYTVEFRFKEQPDDFTSPLEEIVIKNLDQKVLFKFSPNKYSEKPCEDFKIKYSFFEESEKNLFAQKLFTMLGISSFFKSYHYIDEKDFELFIMLLSELIKEVSTNIFWIRLDNFEKQQLVKEIIYSYLIIYEKIPQEIDKLLNHISYVPSLRETPKSYYIEENGQFEKDRYYGLLYDLDERTEYRKINSSDILEKLDGKYHPLTLIEFINKQIKMLNLGEEIKLEPISPSNSLYGLYLYENGERINFSQASSGFKQLLPIIYKAYYDSRPYNRFSQQICIIEQPELHLHPSLQSNLVNMFLDDQVTGRIFIIETHSEHLIRKVQLLIAKGELNQEDIAVYYFDKDEKTKTTSIKEMELEDNGFFKEPWPDGFFDDSYNLARELIYARKN